MKTLIAILLSALPLAAGPLTPLAAELAKPWPKNRTINLVFHGHSVPAGYQKTPDVRPFEAYPHLFTVALKKAYPNPADPLRQRADLIRQLAAKHEFPLADVSASWLARLAEGTPQADLLSQPNHPNLKGNQLAADAIFNCFTRTSKP